MEVNTWNHEIVGLNPGRS